MAWPKGKKRTIKTEPQPEIKNDTIPISVPVVDAINVFPDLSPQKQEEKTEYTGQEKIIRNMTVIQLHHFIRTKHIEHADLLDVYDRDALHGELVRRLKE